MTWKEVLKQSKLAQLRKIMYRHMNRDYMDMVLSSATEETVDKFLEEEIEDQERHYSNFKDEAKYPGGMTGKEHKERLLPYIKELKELR
jgi:flagellar motor component MotA